MAPRLSISHLLFGGTLVLSLVLGSLLVLGLSLQITAIQEEAFIDRANEDIFEFADKFNASVDFNDDQSIRLFLDDLLTQANVNHASFSYKGQLFEPSLGSAYQRIQLDNGIKQHGDQTFFISLPMGLEATTLTVGFDETNIDRSITQIRAQTILFILAYALIWLVVIASFQTYIKARLAILSTMANDIAQGRPLNKRRFLLDDLDELARAIIDMERLLRMREDNLRYMASHDSLTKAANRRQFTQFLNEALSVDNRDRPLALILIDINKFKHVNDTYGHLFGDRLIRFLARSLQRIVGDTGLSARIGGDEFAIVLHYDDDIALDEFCRQIHSKISRNIVLDNTRINVSLGMGVATIAPQEDSMSIERFIHRADTALYQSKRDSILVCYHDDDLLSANYRFKEILHSFQNGSFKQPQNGLTVYFQPKCSLSSGALVGAEALVRWFHPNLGYIDAHDIVGAATELNMLDQLTDMVVGKVIEALCFWREQSIELKVAINIPPSSLSNPHLGKTLESRLLAAALSPKDIELEITEHTVLEQDERVYKLLHSLKQQGFSIAIDDFGVGYANFRNLRNYPFSTIKIDRDFVSEILTNPRDRVIVQATTQVAKDLGMSVVAEGIEDASTIATLRKLGCDYGQGYLFSKAVDKEQLAALYRSNSIASLIKAST